jgi:hypothetical protein
MFFASYVSVKMTELQVLVTGSRDMNFLPTLQIKTIMALYPGRKYTLTHGNCRGADKLTAQVAKSYGWSVDKDNAEWDSKGVAAGPIRNKRMVDRNPDFALAFLYVDSVGTKGCLEILARASRKPNSKLQGVLLVTETTSTMLSPTQLQQRFL